MSREHVEFEAPGTAPDTISACRAVAATARWTIKLDEPDHLVLRQGYKLSAWPLTLDVRVAPASGTGTSVRVDGHIGGAGPIQKRHLRKAMTTLQTEVARPPAP